jgi:hypothetical protein
MYTGMTRQHQLLPDRGRLTVHGQEVAVATGFTFDRYSAGNAADPYPLFRRLREEQPVHFAAEFGVWVVSRYDDVRRVLMDPTRFSSAFRLRSPAVPAPGVADVLAGGYPEVAALVNEDPPAHRHTRDLVVRAFTARRVAALQPYVAEVAGELLDTIEPRGEADLVAELAGPLPLRVICELIGLPAWDAPRVLEWTRQLSALAVAGAGADEQQTAAYESVAFERYLAAEILDRRVRPRDDLLTELTRVQSDGERLSDRQLVSLLISLVFAGHGTTADLIAGALVQLRHRPARSCSCWLPVRAGTTRCSRRRTRSSPGARTGTGTSRSAAASTTAWARRWPGWRRRPRCSWYGSGCPGCASRPASRSRTCPTWCTAARTASPPPGPDHDLNRPAGRSAGGDRAQRPGHVVAAFQHDPPAARR